MIGHHAHHLKIHLRSNTRRWWHLFPHSKRKIALVDYMNIIDSPRIHNYKLIDGFMEEQIWAHFYGMPATTDFLEDAKKHYIKQQYLNWKDWFKGKMLPYLMGNLARQQTGNVGSDASRTSPLLETSLSCINGQSEKCWSFYNFFHRTWIKVLTEAINSEYACFVK